MPVITRRQLRSISHSNPISEGGTLEDALPRTMQESDDDDDPMDGSVAVLSEGGGHESESGASEEEFGRDHLEVDDDYEGTFNTVKSYTSCKLVHSDAPHGKTHKVGEWESVTIEFFGESQEVSSQSWNPRPTAKHAIVAL
jgi:hypothetical protein